MTDAQIQAKATIAAALIQSRSVDAEALGSLNKDISNHKLTHLRDLTEAALPALTGVRSRGVRALRGDRGCVDFFTVTPLCRRPSKNGAPGRN